MWRDRLAESAFEDRNPVSNRHSTLSVAWASGASGDGYYDVETPGSRTLGVRASADGTPGFDVNQIQTLEHIQQLLNMEVAYIKQQTEAANTRGHGKSMVLRVAASDAEKLQHNRHVIDNGMQVDDTLLHVAPLDEQASINDTAAALSNTVEPITNMNRKFMNEVNRDALQRIISLRASFLRRLAPILEQHVRAAGGDAGLAAAGAMSRMGFGGSVSGDMPQYRQLGHANPFAANVGGGVSGALMTQLLGQDPNSARGYGIDELAPHIGALAHGSAFSMPGDNVMKWRVSNRALVSQQMDLVRDRTLMDTVSNHIPQLRRLATVTVYAKPTQLFIHKMIFAPGLADPAAEELSFSEMEFYEQSERRGFEQWGKAMSGTLDALTSIEGQRFFAKRGLQTAGAIAATLLWTTIYQILHEARRQALARPEMRQYPSLPQLMADLGRAQEMIFICNHNPMAFGKMLGEARKIVGSNGISYAQRQEKLLVDEDAVGIVGRQKELSMFEYTGEKGIPHEMTDEEAKAKQGVGRVSGEVVRPVRMNQTRQFDMLKRPRFTGEYFVLNSQALTRQGVPLEEQHTRDIRKGTFNAEHSYREFSLEQQYKKIDIFNTSLLDAVLPNTLLTYELLLMYAANFRVNFEATGARSADTRQFTASMQTAAAETLQRLKDTVIARARTLLATDDGFWRKYRALQHAGGREQKVEAAAPALDKAYDLILKINPRTPTGFEFLTSHGFPVDMSCRIFWPHIVNMGGDAVYMAKDADTVIMATTQPMVAYGHDAMYANWTMRISMFSVPLVTEPEALVFMPSVTNHGYVGGDGINDDARLAADNNERRTMYKNAVQAGRTITREAGGAKGFDAAHVPSYFVLWCQPGEEPWDERFTDIRGQFGAGMTEDRTVQMSTAGAYSNFWGWDASSYKEQDRFLLHQPAGFMNTVCGQRDCFEYNAVAKKLVHNPGATWRTHIINDPYFGHRDFVPDETRITGAVASKTGMVLPQIYGKIPRTV